ncbi:MAG: Holliday junction resolvase RuvX [Alphaproteobacteria bacterium]|nr:Holliday junction resolvase RuvX [Alphaproteobacteria bacterium]
MPLCNIADLKSLLQPGQCLLGLDLGTKTIGLAVCDPGLAVASPLKTLARGKFAADAAALAAVIAERSAGGLVIGLPKNMDGSEGPRAQSARAFAQNFLTLGKAGDIAIAFWDERLSTMAVERFMLEDDMTRKRRDEVVDKAAAAYILQGALDLLKNRAAP